MEEQLDPRRWLTLVVVLAAMVIVVLDNSVLTVAIPTILREFDTTLPSLQWVLSGYSLTFASLLVIGGRLGDLYGPRRMFMVGASLFGLGSLLASLSHSVPQLLVGEALVEGIGAALMMPATIGILSNTFQGRERATAFAAWGAMAGAGVSFGPILGGYLTTYHSWRWAFGINVVVAPIAVLCAISFMRPDTQIGGRPKLDIPGALLVAAGTFSLVFALSQGPSYGWTRPVADFTVNGHLVWPAHRTVSIIPIALLVAAALLACFVRLELRKERDDASPLFDLSEFKHKGFRYGVLTALVMSMGQLGMMFVVPVFLQEGKHLRAVENGLWFVPFGVSILIAAQVGGRLTRIIATTTIVRTGLIIETSGLVAMALLMRLDITLRGLAPAFVLFGIGVGLANSQLTNVVLSDISPDKAGVASGANSTVRQLGSAMGVAIIGAVLSAQAVHRAVDAIRHSTLPANVKIAAIQQIHHRGVSVAGELHTQPAIVHAVELAVTQAARPALLLAASIVAIGAVVSWLIPTLDQRTVTTDDLYDLFEPVDSTLT